MHISVRSAMGNTLLFVIGPLHHHDRFLFQGVEVETDDFDPRLPAFRPAVYTPDSNRLLAGNQMAEVWPGPLTDAYASLRAHFPAREADYFDKPLAVRVEDLEHLDGFHYPFTGEEFFLRRVISLVRTSFIPRNPGNPLFMKALMAAAAGDLKSVPRLSDTGGGGKLGFLIIGPTGCGKTSFADRLMRLFGSRPWLHIQLRERPCQWFQLGAIRVKAKRSLRGTLELGVQCVDAQMRTDFYSQRSQTGSSTRYENNLTAGLTVHAAPYIVIDDVERLLSLRGREAEAILNTFVDIMEYAGIPVILVGTIRAYRMFERFPTIMHKFSSGGVARFGPVPLGRDFKNYTKAMLKQNVSEHSLNEADDLVEQIWLYTCGVRRVAREAVRCLLIRHAYEPGVLLNADLLTTIFNEDLPEYKDSLQLMRQVALGIDPSFMNHQKYEDFVPKQAPKMMTEALDVIRQFRAEHGIKPSGFAEYLTPEVFADLRAKQIAAEEHARALKKKADEEAKREKAAQDERDGNAAGAATALDDKTSAQLAAMLVAGPSPSEPSPGDAGADDSEALSESPVKTIPKKAKADRPPAGTKAPAKKKTSNVVDLSSVKKARPEPVDPSELR